METLVVADAKMAEFHGSGLKRYLLTVLAATAKAFTHPSIRNPVSLVVTRLVVLGPGEGPQVGPSAAQTLRSFCAWQRGLNSANDSDPEHFDTAILFTRQVRGRASCASRGWRGLTAQTRLLRPVCTPALRTYVGRPPVTPWAWPTWAPCATRRGAARWWRTTGCSQPSRRPTSWVRAGL